MEGISSCFLLNVRKIGEGRDRLCFAENKKDRYEVNSSIGLLFFIKKN